MMATHDQTDVGVLVNKCTTEEIREVLRLQSPKRLAQMIVDLPSRAAFARRSNFEKEATRWILVYDKNTHGVSFAFLSTIAKLGIGEEELMSLLRQAASASKPKLTLAKKPALVIPKMRETQHVSKPRLDLASLRKISGLNSPPAPKPALKLRKPGAGK